MSEEDFALEVLIDFFDCVEAGITSARQRIREKKNLPLSKTIEPQLDFNKLFWEEKKGEKGPFQQTSEKANQNSDLWKALKAKLREKQGFWQNQGFSYWFDMKQETIIDRRKTA
jgi:hypothetical protein